jgi:hypothetical protein
MRGWADLERWTHEGSELARRGLFNALQDAFRLNTLRKVSSIRDCDTSFFVGALFGPAVLRLSGFLQRQLHAVLPARPGGVFFRFRGEPVVSFADIFIERTALRLLPLGSGDVPVETAFSLSDGLRRCRKWRTP